MFHWDSEKIRFQMEASEYTPFNDVLAEHAFAHFSKDDSVLDAGCGLGYLSLALAQHVASVTAMDVSEDALRVIRKNVSDRNIKNIYVRNGDTFCLPEDEWFDSMVFCFFGSVSEILRCVRNHCRGKAVLFKKNWTTHRFDINEPVLTKFTFQQTLDELKSLDVPYISESFDVEMGQPFRSLEDVRQFYSVHTQSCEQIHLTDQELRSKLSNTNSTEFPYFLSSKRSVGMIVIDSCKIPKSI